MIELSNLLSGVEALPAAANRPRGDAPAFSYARAAAALEQRAGAALKTHGAAPTLDDPAAALQVAARARARASADREGAGAQPAAAPAAQAASPATQVPASPPPQAAPAAPSAPVAAQGQAPAGLAPAPPSPPSAAPARPAIAADAPRAQSPRPADKSAARTVRADPPARTPAAFAEVIARRLGEGKSEFEIRLDPPQLGRVEGRLVLGDDGEATLALVFDNQAALDRFAADGAALRAALASAGFDLGGSALSFTLAEREGSDGGSRRSGGEAGRDAPSVAPFAFSSVIDIRI